MLIRMPRGDLRYIRFKVNDPSGTITEIDFTEIYFTVKKSTRIRGYCFQKKLSTGGITKLKLGDYQLRIEPQDTDDLVYGNYKFDIQLKYENNGLKLQESFVGDFMLTEEVTFAENE